MQDGDDGAFLEPGSASALLSGSGSAVSPDKAGGEARVDPWHESGDPWLAQSQPASKRSRTPIREASRTVSSCAPEAAVPPGGSTGNASAEVGAAAGGGGSAGSADKYISEDDVMRLLMDTKTEILAGVTGSFETQFGKFQTVVGALSHRQTQDKRELQGAMQGITARQDDAANEQALLRAEVDSLKRQMSALERQAPTAKQINEDLYGDWDREPDPTILLIGCQQLVDKQSIQHVLNECLAEAGIANSEAVVQGAPGALQKKWRVTFDNDNPAVTRGLAAQRVAKIRELQQESDGSWKDRFVSLPNGNRIKAYINGDQSPKQSAVEMSCKRLRAVVADHFPPPRAVHAQKRAGTVTLDWTELVHVECPAKGRVNLRWNEPAFELLQFSTDKKEAIRQSFNARIGQASGVQWSV